MWQFRSYREVGVSTYSEYVRPRPVIETTLSMEVQEVREMFTRYGGTCSQLQEEDWILVIGTMDQDGKQKVFAYLWQKE